MKISTKNYEFRLNGSCWKKKPKAYAYGSTNRTIDGFYIPYIDYDHIPLSNIIPELMRLQDQFRLSDLHIYRSSPKGYHVIGFDKLTATQFLQLLQQSSCDQAFRDVPRWYSPSRAWILRHSEKGKTNKPTYVKTLCRNAERRQSSAHYKLVSVLYGKLPALTYPDKLKTINGVRYETSNNLNNGKN